MDNQPTVYDKVERKSHPAKLDSICYENFLYDIAPDFATFDDGTTKVSFIEDTILSKEIEPQFAKLLNEINDTLDTIAYNSTFPEPLRERLAYNIIIQYLRMPQIKQATQQLNDDILPKMVRLFQQGLAKELGDEQIAKLQLNSKYDVSRTFYEQTFGSEELVNTFSKAILDNRWIFLYSPDGGFYSSDNPCVVIQSTNSRPFCLGLAQFGSEIIYPILPELAVIIYDRNYYSDLEVSDNSVNYAQFEHIAHINLNIYEQAKRFVFSKKCDFKLVEQYTYNGET